MKSRIYSIVILMFCLLSGKAQQDQEEKYIPVDKVLFDRIESMDKEFFDAYNSCDLKKQELIYSDSIEFFHDKAGLITSKAELILGTKNNICGKVTRTLIPGSMEVYPIKNYGAIEMGLHKFYNNQEPNAESKPSKFIIFWKLDGENWKIVKVVSLH
jgi:hypothetical protein